MADFLSELRTWLLTAAAAAPSASALIVASGTFYSKMPDTPTGVVVLYESGSLSEQMNPKEEQSVRVTVRNADRATAVSVAKAAYDLLHIGGGSALMGVDLTSFHVFTAYAVGRPQQIGVDENNYPLIGFDVDLQIREL